MKLNRKWLMVIALVMSLTMATAGTLAYLTDRDTEVNVFTMGNVDIELKEDFIQDSELIPGLDIEKEPTITNVGKNDAWVWATIAIPSALDNDDASRNVLHFNYSKDSIAEGKWTWQKDGAWMVEKNVEKDDVYYNVYTVLYQTALKKGDTTEPVIYKVYMDANVDIHPDGEMYHVENGVATKLGWNINNNGNPKMYVSAYAMQTDGFATVREAYAAYTQQWGTDANENAIAWGEDDGVTDSGIPEVAEPALPTTSWMDYADTAWYDASSKSYEINTAAELAGLSKLVYEGNTFSGKTITLNANVNLEDHLWMPIGRMVNTGSTGENSTFKGTFNGNDNTVSNLFVDTTDAIAGNDNDKGAGLFGAVRGTIKNVTVDKAIIKTAHWGAAIAGNVEVGGIENCHAKNVTIECLPELINGSYDNGDKSGAIAGYISEGAAVKKCTVTNAEITGYRDIGGVVGYANANVIDCTIFNVTLNLDKTNNYKNYSSNDEFDLNSFVGETGTGMVTNCTGTATINYGN